MNAEQALDYMASIEHNNYLGILQRLDLSKGPRIEIPHMTRKKMSRLFRKMGYRTGIEVGVYKGHFSLCLTRCIPGAKIYSIDPYQAYEGYHEGYTQEALDALYDEARELLAPWTNVELIRKFSVDAAKKFDDGSIDFVYIDGNHRFEYVTADIAAWSPKVRPGGAVSGHDYVRYPHIVCEVKDAVNTWTRHRGIEPWFIIHTQGRASRAGWFWIKR